MSSSSHSPRLVRIQSSQGEFEMKLIVRNSARSTGIDITISSHDTLTLVKQTRIPMSEAYEYISESADWIFENRPEPYDIDTLSEHLKNNPILFDDMGSLRVEIIPARAESFFLKDEEKREVVFAVKDNDNEELKYIFLQYAQELISKLSDKVSAQTNLRFSRISIRNQSSCWASRSSTGTLSFNWRIALLPYELQNYIICHEFAHIRFMDHSTSFWIFLNRICPNAKRLDAELGREGSKIFKIEREY